MVMKTKKLLTIGFLLVSLILVILMWLFGWRMEPVREMILLLRSKPPKLSTEETTELHTWLKENAIHLNSVEAGSGFEDMQPLKAIIGDARIVALGEATHGTREFFQIKHRMVEFLVSEMDFTVFAIEATLGGAFELNDYVLTGNGDPERALGALVYPAWNTEEVLALVNWMREYNSSHEKKVKFYGIDMKPTAGSAKAVYNFLRKIDGTHDYDEVLSLLMNLWTAGRLITGPKEKIYSAAEEIEGLIAHIESQQPADARQTPSRQEIQDLREWKLVVLHAKVLLQYLNHYSMPTISSGVRDPSMAENVRGLMDYEDGAKMILWAHNAHVAAGFGGGMGQHLRKMYGNDIVNIGLTYNRGFSRYATSELSPENSHEIPPAPEGTLEATLTKAGLEIAVLDLRSLPRGTVSKYFNARLEIAVLDLRSLPRGTVSKYFNARLQTRFGEHFITSILPMAYDALLFIESTTGVRPLRVGSLGGTAVRLQNPSNLDFEQIEDGRLKDWKFQGGQSLLEYQTTGSHNQPYKGNTCGMIKKFPGRSFGEAFGKISQSIKAYDFRGETIRFTAVARVDDGIGYLWLSIDKTSRSPAIFHQQIITSDKWQEYYFLAEVPQKASKITYGLAYVGQGAAFIDDVTIGNSN